MKQLRLIFLLNIILLTGCLDKKKAIIKMADLLPFPVLIDTIGVDKFPHFLDGDEPTWLTTSNYNFYFIGQVKDTIYLNPILNFIPPPPPPPDFLNKEKGDEHEATAGDISPYKKYYIEWDKEKRYRAWYQVKVDVRIDTSANISGSHPVMITNQNTDTIFIGHGRFVPLIMEAKDSLGKWQPIQQRFVYMCGNGVGSIILPPNECAITLAPIFKGNYKTKLRLALGDNYSNPFDGAINYRQFQSIFDEHGEYREEYKREMDENEKTN